MWWAGTDSRTVEILLGRTGWAVCSRGGLVGVEIGLDPKDVLPSLCRQLSSLSGAAWWRPVGATVSLSGAFCRPFLLPALPPLTRAEERLVIEAAAKARTGFQEDVQIWLSRVYGNSAGNNQAHQIGAAVPLVHLAAVQSALRRVRGVKLRSIQPVWSLALKLALGGSEGVGQVADMLLVRDPDAVTILAGVKADEQRSTDAREGFAAALTVESGHDATAERNAIMRVVSGLASEPSEPVQFEIGFAALVRPPQPPGETAAEVKRAEPKPLEPLWALRAYEIESL